MKKLLYFGADIDISPILLFPKIKEFVFMDLGDVNHLAHWGVEEYNGFIIPRKPRHWLGKDLQSTLKIILLKFYPDVKVSRTKNIITYIFDKERTIKYYTNVFLPNYDKKKCVSTQFNSKETLYKNYIQTSLTKNIIDEILSCNILYVLGYFPGYPIVSLLNLDIIYTQDYVMYDSK